MKTNWCLGEVPCLPPKKRRMLEHYQQESRSHGASQSKSTQDDDAMDINSPPQANAISSTLGTSKHNESLLESEV